MSFFAKVVESGELSLRRIGSFELVSVLCAVLGAILGANQGDLLAQDRASATDLGFNRLTGRHIEIVTDLPLDDDIRQLPSVFDAAVRQWCVSFSVPEPIAANWRATAYLMGVRERFVTAGKLPKTHPKFVHGFQWGDDLWVNEQRSAYYRRHLLLHEGTHWFMVRKYGHAGPPWLMEGLAEWHATHRWDGTNLTLGIVPRSNTDVPYWGRITLIQDQLEMGVAPSLENILRYGNTAHQQVDAYAWSWAAVLFMRHHPDTRSVFQELLNGELKSDVSLTRGLIGKLRARWPAIRQEWLAVLSELEYGYDAARGMPVLATQLIPLEAPREFTISAAQSWQGTSISVSANQKIEISASGRYTVGVDPKPWICEPQGVTLRYYRHQPLGKLSMAILAPESKEPSLSDRIRTYSIGIGAEVRCPRAGELFFKVNESVGGLEDNSGEIRIAVVPK